MEINYKKSRTTKTALLFFMLAVALLIVFVPLQMSAYALPVETTVATVEYNGSTYYAKYNVKFSSTSADTGTTPYEFENLNKMALVQNEVKNAWLTNFKVSNLKTTLTKPDGSIATTIFEDYSFYKSAPTKTFYDGNYLASGNYTLRIECTIARGDYSSSTDKTISFRVI